MDKQFMQLHDCSLKNLTEQLTNINTAICSILLKFLPLQKSKVKVGLPFFFLQETYFLMCFLLFESKTYWYLFSEVSCEITVSLLI